MAAQNMLFRDRLLEYIDMREQAAMDNMETLEEFDPVIEQEQAILDTYTLLRYYIKEETDT